MNEFNNNLRSVLSSNPIEIKQTFMDALKYKWYFEHWWDKLILIVCVGYTAISFGLFVWNLIF